jgi:predicted dehydrogenase
MNAPDLPYRPPDPATYKPAIGLIGCGMITEYHLKAYKAAGYNIVALCDCRDAKAIERKKQFYPEAAIYTDHRALLRRDDIEVVDIATHPGERVALIEDALRAGKHVLSQKPFVADLDVGERLCDLADKAGRKLAVNQNGRWAPHWSYLRQLVANGFLGDVRGAELSVYWDHNWTAGTPFDQVRHLVLYDFGIHWFDILTQFFPRATPVRVFATTRHAPGQRSKPDLMARAVIDFDNAQAALSFDGSTSARPIDTTSLVGSEGRAKSVGPDLNDQTVTVSIAEGAASPDLAGTWFTSGFHGTMAELLSAIEENRTPNNNARDNLKSLALCFAALTSADTGRPQVVGATRRVPQ